MNLINNNLTSGEKTAVKESFENPFFLYNLLDYNNDYLIVDTDNLLVNNYQGQGIEEDQQLSIYRDGTNRMLLNLRGWRNDRLYTPLKWVGSNFQYQNLESTYTELDLDTGYMDLYKPKCVVEDLEIENILAEINSTTGAQWQNSPLLYQNWYQIFLNIRNKSFKK